MRGVRARSWHTHSGSFVVAHRDVTRCRRWQEMLCTFHGKHNLILRPACGHLQKSLAPPVALWGFEAIHRAQPMMVGTSGTTVCQQGSQPCISPRRYTQDMHILPGEWWDVFFRNRYSQDVASPVELVLDSSRWREKIIPGISNIFRKIFSSPKNYSREFFEENIFTF